MNMLSADTNSKYNERVSLDTINKNLIIESTDLDQKDLEAEQILEQDMNSILDKVPLKESVYSLNVHLKQLTDSECSGLTDLVSKISFIKPEDFIEIDLETKINRIILPSLQIVSDEALRKEIGQLKYHVENVTHVCSTLIDNIKKQISCLEKKAAFSAFDEILKTSQVQCRRCCIISKDLNQKITVIDGKLKLRIFTIEKRKADEKTLKAFGICFGIDILQITQDIETFYSRSDDIHKYFMELMKFFITMECKVKDLRYQFCHLAFFCHNRIRPNSRCPTAIAFNTYYWAGYYQYVDEKLTFAANGLLLSSEKLQENQKNPINIQGTLNKQSKVEVVVSDVGKRNSLLKIEENEVNEKELTNVDGLQSLLKNNPNIFFLSRNLQVLAKKIGVETKELIFNSEFFYKHMEIILQKMIRIDEVKILIKKTEEYTLRLNNFTEVFNRQSKRARECIEKCTTALRPSFFVEIGSLKKAYDDYSRLMNEVDIICDTLIIELSLCVEEDKKLASFNQNTLELLSLCYGITPAQIVEALNELRLFTATILSCMQDLQKNKGIKENSINDFRYQFSFLAYLDAEGLYYDYRLTEEYFLFWYSLGYYKYIDQPLYFTKSGQLVKI